MSDEIVYGMVKRIGELKGERQELNKKLVDVEKKLEYYEAVKHFAQNFRKGEDKSE